MKRKRIVGSILVFVLAILLGFTGFSVYKYYTNKPPVSEIEMARKNLAAAKNANAMEFSGAKLKEAEKLYNQAMTEWEVQNVKIFLFRDYSQVRQLALNSLKFSETAGSEASFLKISSEKQAEKELEKVQRQIETFEKKFKKLPVGRTNFDLYNQGKMKYIEARHEFENKDYKQSLSLLKTAGEKLTKVENAAKKLLADFYDEFGIWQKNQKLAYSLSKKDKIVVLIDKMAGTFVFIKSGKIIKTFPAEFGPNWMGDKKKQGDLATPEGVYKITEKKTGSNTKYYKALLLNYPNDEDKTRFEKLVRSGKIDKKTNIGGLIEIHGGGGKGVHWTDGCIALENDEMDIAFSLCKTNTPVIIIGSGKSLEEYLN